MGIALACMGGPIELTLGSKMLQIVLVEFVEESAGVFHQRGREGGTGWRYTPGYLTSTQRRTATQLGQARISVIGILLLDRFMNIPFRSIRHRRFGHRPRRRPDVSAAKLDVSRSALNQTIGSLEPRPGQYMPPSPGHGSSKIVKIMQARAPLMRFDRLHQIRNAFVDGQACRRPAHIGLHPSGRHDQ